MNAILDNFSNPALLFFLLGIIASQIKSDLQIPETSAKFISVYLLLSIGFKGGQELIHAHAGLKVLTYSLIGIASAFLFPLLSFRILKKRMGVDNAAAIAASYGSVSAVTFITAIAFLDEKNIPYGSFMIAAMALMEVPAIIVGVFMVNRNSTNHSRSSFSSIIKHAITNGSVFLLIGSLLIGMITSDKQADGIRPFTTDIFKGFLTVFLLDMGLSAGRQLKGLWKNGPFVLAFSILTPIFQGITLMAISSLIIHEPGNLFLMGILGASASYIAVPAAMRQAVPKADPGIYLPMALGMTFPFNIIAGLPLYWFIAQALVAGN
ncbi:MAG: hypothetical protein RL263_1202 [Bacteroidota bacterium]